MFLVFIVSLNMYYTTVAFLVTLLFANIATNDQNDWIEQSEKNAKKNLDNWPNAVDGLITGKQTQLVRDEILLFQTQVDDSVGNMKSFVPDLISVVNYINSTMAANPNFFRRGVLHTILWYIEGKRDNKSYYLLDGTVNWVLNRLPELSSKGRRAAELETKLLAAKDAIANLRDELDSNAQNYVKSIAQIDQLSQNICENINEMRAIAKDLVTAFEKSSLLKDADNVNNLVKGISV